MKKLSFLIFILCLIFAQRLSAGNVNYVEYFVDTDPGFGNGTSVSISPDSIVQLNFTIDANQYDDGFHTLYIRAKSVDNDTTSWSLSHSHPFFKVPTGDLPNIVYSEYFIDTDPGFNNGTSISLGTQDTLIELNPNINITDLDDGFHTLYIRGRNADNEWGLSHAHPFFKMAVGQLTNIVQTEYFIDDDPGFGNGTPIAFSPQDTSITINADLDIESLSDGFHTLYIRAKDENGGWSLSHTHPFFKMAMGQVTNIVQTEYFIDDDPGFGNGEAIAFSPQDTVVIIDVDIDMTQLDDGFHTLYVRAKDENDGWSLSHTHPFFKMATGGIPNISDAEYFIDTDPGLGNGDVISIASGQDITIDFTAEVATLDHGFHTLFIRAKDENGNWGISHTAPFYFEDLGGIPNITSVDYYFASEDTITDELSYASFTPGIDVDLEFPADTTGLAPGVYNLHIYGRDANGKRGLGYVHPFLKGGGEPAALQFDGIDDHVVLGSWNAGADWTIQAWVKPDSLPDGRKGIAGGFADGYDWGLSLYDGKLSLTIKPSNCSTTQTISWDEPISTNKWYHMAGTCDGYTATLYVNGEAKASTPVCENYVGTSSGVWIGGEVCCPDNHFPGMIDEVQIWDYPLSQSDIRNNMYRQLTGNNDGLLGYWPLEEGSGVNAFDASGNGREGTLENGAVWINSPIPLTTDVPDYLVEVSAVWSGITSSTSSIMGLSDSDISGEEVVYFGHDNGGIIARRDDVPDGIVKRLNRLWQLQTEDDLNGDIKFSCAGFNVGSPDDLRLLISSDETFADATIANGFYDEEIQEFTVYTQDYLDGYYYTLASVSDNNVFEKNAAIAFHYLEGSYEYMATQNSYISPRVFTVSVWFKTDKANGLLLGFGNQQTGGSNQVHRRLYLDADGRIHFGVKYGGTFYNIGSEQDETFVDNHWHHAAATLSSAGMKLYVDGNLIAANPAVTNANIYSGYWRIGYDIIESWHGTNVYWPQYEGDIDEVSVWSRALSQSEIRNIMHKELMGDENGLTSYWQFNEGEGQTIIDASGNGNTGTLIGDVDWITTNSPISISELSEMQNIAAVWVSRKTSSSSIMTVEDSDISGEDYIIFGNNGANLVFNKDNIPPAVNARLERFWKLDVFGDALNGSVSFDLSQLGLTDADVVFLLIDDDTDFSDATSLPGDFTDNIFTIDNHTFEDDKYYTIGVLGQSVTFLPEVIQADVGIGKTSRTPLTLWNQHFTSTIINDITPDTLIDWITISVSDTTFPDTIASESQRSYWINFDATDFDTTGIRTGSVVVEIGDAEHEIPVYLNVQYLCPIIEEDVIGDEMPEFGIGDMGLMTYELQNVGYDTLQIDTLYSEESWIIPVIEGNLTSIKIPPEQKINVEIYMDTENLEPGDYYKFIDLITNEYCEDDTSFIGFSFTVKTPSIYPCNGGGDLQYTFDLYEAVHITGEDFPFSQAFDAYLVPWDTQDGDSLPEQDIFGENASLTTNADGTISPTTLWYEPTADYEDQYFYFVVDWNGNGIYEPDTDLTATSFLVTDLTDEPEIYAAAFTGSRRESPTIYNRVDMLQPLYALGSGFYPSDTVEVYIVRDIEGWQIGDTLRPIIEPTIIETDIYGQFEEVIWDSAGVSYSREILLGGFDVVADLDRDGIYTDDDVLDSDEITGVTITTPMEPPDTTQHRVMDLSAYKGSRHDYGVKNTFRRDETVYFYMTPEDAPDIPPYTTVSVYIVPHNDHFARGDFVQNGDKLSEMKPPCDKDDPNGNSFPKRYRVQPGCRNGRTMALSARNMGPNHPDAPPDSCFDCSDIIVDVNNNGIYDLGVDIIDGTPEQAGYCFGEGDGKPEISHTPGHGQGDGSGGDGYSDDQVPDSTGVTIKAGNEADEDCEEGEVKYYLWARVQGDSDWPFKTQMAEEGGSREDKYQAKIPAEYIIPPGCEYKIIAESPCGSDEAGPYFIPVGECFTAGGLTFCLECEGEGETCSYQHPDDNTYIVNGPRVVVQGVGVIDGNITVTKDPAAITGNARIYLRNIPYLTGGRAPGEFEVYSGQFNANLASALTGFLGSNGNLANVGGFEVSVSEIGFISGGIRLKGKIVFPDYLNGELEFENLQVSSSRGVDMVGSVNIEEYELGPVAVNEAFVDFDTQESEYTGGMEAEIGKLCTIAGGMKFSEGALDSVMISVEGALGIYITPATPVMVLTGGGGAMYNLKHWPNDYPYVWLFTYLESVGKIGGTPLLKMDKAGIRIEPMHHLSMSSGFELVGQEVGDAAIGYDHRKGLYLEVNAQILKDFEVYSGKLNLNAYSVRHVTGSLLCTVQIPDFETDGYADWALKKVFEYTVGLPCEIGRQQGSFLYKYPTDLYMQGLYAVGPLSVAVKLEIWPSTKLYIGKNFEKLYNIYGRGTRGTVTEPINVGENLPTIIITVRTENGPPLDFNLVTPSGDTLYYDQDYDGVMYGTGDDEFTGSFYVIEDPEGGEWTVTVPNDNGQPTEIFLIGQNNVPTIQVSQPSQQHTTNTIIQWQDDDPDNNARISLFYDVDNTGFDGNLIVENIMEDDDWGDSYNWNTSDIPTGDYYIYAMIEDSLNAPVFSYSPGTIKVVQPDAPSKPTGIYASQTDSLLIVGWESIPEEAALAGYQVYYTNKPSGDIIGDIATLSAFADSNRAEIVNVTFGHTYRIIVAGVDTLGNMGEFSDPISYQFVSQLENNTPMFTTVDPLDQAMADSLQTLTYEYTFQAEDADANDNLTFSILDAPTGFTIDNSGYAHWTPSLDDIGTYTVMLQVSDGTAADTLSYTLFVVDSEMSKGRISLNSREYGTWSVGFVTVKDADFTNATQTDSLTVTISSNSTPLGIDVYCYETSANSQEFLGAFALSDLSASIGDTITATYDDDNPVDSYTSTALVKDLPKPIMRIDILILQKLISKLGTQTGEAGYNDAYDRNGNDMIDTEDLKLIMQEWGVE